MRRCDGISRREILRVGNISAIGLGLSQALQLRASAARPGNFREMPNCILIWLDGGPSHMDTFDLKPDAPAEVRGDLKPISTNVDGIQISEYFQRLAKLADKCCIIRSLTSELGVHGLGSQYLLTGYKPSPVIEYPSYGSVVSQWQQEPSILPTYITLRQNRLQAGNSLENGYLPETSRPFSVEADPSQPSFRVRDLHMRSGMTLDSLERRRQFVKDIDLLSEQVEATAIESAQDAQFEQAYRLILSKEAKAAFDLRKESDETRDRYGKRYNRRTRIGQCCLLARRLIEAGSKFVTVTDNGWDMHGGIYNSLSQKLPAVDHAVSSLINDLEDRGLLDETLVIVMGEFGRTPRLNAAAGRDHWPRAFSMMMAGGGVKGGQVVGATDPRGYRPTDRPVSPTDLARTIYALLGISPDHKFHTTDGRPIAITPEGETISEVIA